MNAYNQRRWLVDRRVELAGSALDVSRRPARRVRQLTAAVGWEKFNAAAKIDMNCGDN